MNTAHTAHTARHATTATLARWALLLALSFGGLAMAQGEATLDQVYQAAQAGRVEQALEMMQPVLKAHPASAKAHFVQAELLARQGQAAQARTELATAERLAPGLPFAKSDAVQHLQRELALPQGQARADQRVSTTLAHTAAAPAAPASSSVPWGVVLALVGGAVAAWLLMRLGRSAAQPQPGPAAGPSWSASGGRQGTTAMGAMTQMTPMAPAASMNPAYQMNPMGAGGMAQPASGAGLGSRLAGGLATGLAVGAGVMAAESIGRNLFGGGSAHATAGPDASTARGFDPVFGNADANPDMGGNDFGIGDAGSWDDTPADTSDWDA